MYQKGQSVEVEIGGRKLLMKPLPFGTSRRVVQKISAKLEELSKMGDKKDDQEKTTGIHEFFNMSLDLFEDIKFDIIQKEYNDFADEAWIEKNVTIPDMQKLSDVFFEINGVLDFFSKVPFIPRMEEKGTQLEEATKT